MAFELLGYYTLGYNSDTEIDDIKYTDLIPVNKNSIEKIKQKSECSARMILVKQLYFEILDAIEDGLEFYEFTFKCNVGEDEVIKELQRLFPDNKFSKKPKEVFTRCSYRVYL